MLTKFIKKNLAGLQDLFFGEGQVTQTRNGGFFNIDGIRGFWPVNNQAEWDAIDPIAHPKIVTVFAGEPVKFYRHDGNDWVALSIDASVSVNDAFKSIVFKRSNTIPTKPPSIEGSYANPVPTGWSDGIPAGQEILWATSRTFSRTGEAPQDAAWADVSQIADTATTDYKFSSVESNPGTPATAPGNWVEVGDETTWWMAVQTIVNGVASSWSIMKIRGEDGTDGTDGDDGTAGPRGAGRYYADTLPAPYTWASNDVAANNAGQAACPDGFAIEGDVVTLYKPGDRTVNQTRLWKNNQWESFASIIPGNQLVEGTVVADEVRVGAIFGQNATFLGTIYAGNMIGDTAAGGAKVVNPSLAGQNGVELTLVEFTLQDVDYNRLVVYPVITFLTGNIDSGDTLIDLLDDSRIEVKYYKDNSLVYTDTTVRGIGSYNSKPYATQVSGNKGSASVLKVTIKWFGTGTVAPVIAPQAAAVQIYRESSQITFS